jgi:hypothetical protein
MSDETTFSRQADAFGPVALETFALNPTGAHLFRAQHGVLLGVAAQVTSNFDAGLASAQGAAALDARNGLTRLHSLFSVHQDLEVAILRRTLQSDPRARAQMDQLEREMAPLSSELAAISRRFAAPSYILANAEAFTNAFSSLHIKLQERFRAEERELFPAFDKSVGAAGPAGALFGA